MEQHPLVKTAPIPVSSKRLSRRTTPDEISSPVRTGTARAFRAGSIKAISQDSLVELEAGRRARLLDDLTPMEEYDPTSWRMVIAEDSDSSSEEEDSTTEEEDLTTTEIINPSNSPILRSLVEVPFGNMGPTPSNSTATQDLTISLTTPTWSLTFSSTNLLLHENLLQQLPLLLRSLHLTQRYNNN